MLDISKFFERLRHSTLLHIAAKCGFPARLAWVAVRLYRAPRVIRYGVFSSETMLVKGGVIAGCSIAMALATVYMIRIHEDFHKLPGSVHLTGMVDDLKLEVHGNADKVVEHMVLAEALVVKHLEDLVLPLNRSKSQVLCSSAKVKRMLGYHWAERGYEWVTQTRNLGGQLSTGLRRRTTVHQMRRKKAAVWVKRARRLRDAGAPIASLVRAGVVQSVGYADQIVPWKPAALHSWACKLARCIHKVPKVSCPRRYLRVHPDGDSSCPERRHNAAVVEAWVFSIWMQRFSTHDMEDAITMAARRLVKAKRPAYVVSGPITGFLQVCLALEWKVHSASEIEDHNRIRYDLHKRSPAFMSGLAKEATRCALDKGFRKRRALQGNVSWWAPIDAVRRKVKKSRDKASVFANLASGCWWTSHTMHRKGIADSPSCAICGCDEGTYAHRLLHCIGLQRYRDRLPDEVRGYLLRLCKDGDLESQLWAPVWPDMISIPC
eukprot:4720846-Amphidinium_carterae.1